MQTRDINITALGVDPLSRRREPHGVLHMASFADVDESERLCGVADPTIPSQIEMPEVAIDTAAIENLSPPAADWRDSIGLRSPISNVPTVIMRLL